MGNRNDSGECNPEGSRARKGHYFQFKDGKWVCAECGATKQAGQVSTKSRT